MANEKDYTETTELQNNGLQIYQQDKASIDMQISTAKAYPRDLQKAIQNSISIVTMDMEVAKSCCYSLNKGGKIIAGPSVYLARILAQQMGNMRVENRVVGFDATHATCEAVCFDLERNYAVRTQIKKSIVGNRGRFTEDMCTIIANAGNAIAFRNAIFNVVDKSIVDKVYNAARGKITGDITDENKLIARRTSLIKGIKETFNSYNITDEEIAKCVGKNSVSHIGADEMVMLIGLANCLKEGEMTVESVFRPGSVNKFTADNKDAVNERVLKLIDAQKDRKSLSALLPKCTSTELKAAYDKKFAELK